MNYLLIIGLVLAGIGIIGLFGQPKTDKRTKTGIEKGKTTSYGLCFILIAVGAGLIYIDSKFFSDEQKSSVTNKSDVPSDVTPKQTENNEKDAKESNFERSDSIRSGDY